MRTDLLDEYESEREVEYRGEAYLVRDNGAVWRNSRPGQRRRRLDDAWTFGAPSASRGYMYVGSHVVHQIVALAFHERPSEKHVVDHIDTNRRNNRADNLRWLTRLDNVLLNPITLARIVRVYGSLDAFFKDPAAVSRQDPAFSWMRTVSKSEAEECRKRLLGWAESDRAPSGGQLGEWVYGQKMPVDHIGDETRDFQSLTPMAIQRSWKTISEFPACPDAIGIELLSGYAARLVAGEVFCRNKFGDAVVQTSGEGAGVLGVLCRMPQPSVKDWALSKVTVENGKFVHESGGTFFTLDGGLNAYRKLLGIDAPHVETIDDYC